MKAERTLAKVGLVLVVSIILAAVLIPVHAGDGTTPNTVCLTNIKQVVMSVMLYASDHDDLLPTVERWYDDTRAYRKAQGDARWQKLYGQYRCPSLSSGVGYAMNDARRRFKSDPAHWPMLFESADIRTNAHSTIAGILEQPRHGGVSVAFGDGYARSIHPSKDTTVIEQVLRRRSR